MKAHHAVSLKNIIVDQKSLQDAWNYPARISMLAGREALVVLVVVKDKNGYFWNGSVRIHKKSKPQPKKLGLWTAIDNYEARKILNKIMDGAGVQEGEEEFVSEWALHFQRKLTSEELSFALEGELLGKVKVEGMENGSIRGQHEGEVLEDDHVSHDSGHDGGTSGDGGQDRSEEEVDPEGGNEPGTL